MRKFDFEVDRDKRHIVMIHKLTRQRITLPKHKEIKTGTLREIINQAGITRDDFLNAFRR